MATDSILNAKTVKAFIKALNEEYKPTIDDSSGGKQILEDLLSEAITVKKGDGNPLLYCAQADTPSLIFGLTPDNKGTVVIQFLNGLAQVVFKKCNK
jgi:hypothetical protein